MGDGFLASFKASALDQVVDLIADELWYPDIRLPIPALAAGLAKTLNALDTFLIRHDIHLCHS